MSDSTKKGHYHTSKKYKNHFDEFDFFKRDLSKMRLKQDSDKRDKDRLAHFQDMKESSDIPCDKGINYKIYKPVYNIYKNDFQERVDEQKKQLDSYHRINEYLSDMVDVGGLSEIQMENTRREQRDILKEMDSVKEKISSITDIDSTIK